MSQPEKEILERGGRVPPQAVEVEEAVLGSCLLEQEAAGKAMQMLEFTDFYKPAHQHIFKQIGELYDSDESLDMLTVEQHLRDKGLLDTCGGGGYLSELTRSVSSAANVDYHAQIIREKSLKRQTILDCSDTIKEAYQSDSDPYDVLDNHAAKIDKLTLGHQQRSAMKLGDIMPEVLDEIGLTMENPGNITGVPSGTDVDDFTGGWQNEDLIIIAGRPSMGKTAYVLNAARSAALCKYDELRTNSAIFSLEMGKKSLVKRFLCMEQGINQHHVNTGRIKKSEYEQLCTDTAQKLYDVGIYIDDTPGLRLRAARSKARRLVRNKDVGLIIFDYLQLMTAPGADVHSREQEIAKISRGLKALAKELNVPVIALSQLSRKVEDRNPPRPKLSDLRRSGQIEQDADVVCFLYRPEYYDITNLPNGSATENKCEIIIAKQRNGPTTSVWMQFFKDKGRFKNAADEYFDEEEPF